MDFFQLSTKLELTWGYFKVGGGHVQIETHVWPSQKILNSIGIPF